MIQLSLFNSLHLSILSAVILIPAGLARIPRVKEKKRFIRYLLAFGIALAEFLWYGTCVRRGWAHYPDRLPFQLCDITLWMTVVMLLEPKAWLFDVAYYWGLAGSGMALLTPDVGRGAALYPMIQFFVAHGGVVAGILYLLWAKILQPRGGSWLKSWLALNGYAALIAIFNLTTGANYMYLSRKPAHLSILDYFGPWPWYIFSADAVALVLFWLLYQPLDR